MDELVIGDKTYISSKQAAKITGYAKDYVGQLCREGRVEARLVGRNWFVLEASIREHRFGAESTPVATPEPEPVIVEAPIETPKATPLSTWDAPSYTPIQEEPFIPALETPKKAVEAPDTAEAVALMQDAWKEWFETRQKELPHAEEMRESKALPAIIEEEEIAPEPVRYSDIPSIYAAEKVSHDREEEAPIHVTRIDEEPEIEEEYVASVPVYSRPHADVPVQIRPQQNTRGVIDLSRVNREAYEEPAPRRVHVPKRRVARKSGLAVQAIILSVSALVALGAIVGSGAIDEVLTTQGIDTSLRGAIFDTLRGESRVKK